MAKTTYPAKRIDQAAGILSSFNFKDVGYCAVSFYFATEVGARGSGVNSYNEDFRKWGKKEWCERISKGARRYAKNSPHSPTEVTSIVIAFNTKEQSIHDPLYTIEMTDLTSGYFDRLIIRSDNRSIIGQVTCTIKESSCIRGALDVVRLTKKMPPARIEKIPTDLPKVVLNDNAARRNQRQ